MDKSKLILELQEIHRDLVEVYYKIFKYKFNNIEDFQNHIREEYRKNKIRDKNQEDWNEKFCHRAAYSLLNKILFLRICQDQGFLDKEPHIFGGPVNFNQDKKELAKYFTKWTSLIVGHRLDQLIKLIFYGPGKTAFNRGLCQDSKYEILNPSLEDLKSKKLNGDLATRDLVIEFEELLQAIMVQLARDRFDLARADSNILGDIYESFMSKDIRKAVGQFYTPEFIIEYILNNTIAQADILENPFIRLADIACGSGHFLSLAYDILKEKFTDKLGRLRNKYANESYTIIKGEGVRELGGRQYWTEENLHYHILKNCIYGADIDSFAVQLTTINLLLKDLNNFTWDLNIINCDSLIKWDRDYNWRDLEGQLQEDFESLTYISSNLFGEEEAIRIRQKRQAFNLKYKNIDGIEVCQTINRQEAEQIVRIGGFWSKKFDYIVGNPPYLGHKQLDIKYKNWLVNNYGEVFRDKSDLSFCFFSRTRDILKEGGVGGIISSRYFMESPTGQALRSYLKNKTSLIKIVDFYGGEIFKEAGVATGIYIFKKTGNKDNKITVHKLLDDRVPLGKGASMEKLLKGDLFESFTISQDLLREERWLLLADKEYKIYKKIEGSSKYKLKDLAESFQGIITGCDRAFVMTEEEARQNNIEGKLLKKWIKNSNIEKYQITEGNLRLIYADLIDNKEEYPNALNFIERHKDRLKNRRECRRGIRKWYHLQWGRDHKQFDQKKIVFPYKARTNRFALDSNKLYYSADIYALILKDEFKSRLSLEYLLGILNSSIYEFYFKLFAKKMGKGMYDYYPNSIMDLTIPLDRDLIGQIEARVREILKNKDDNRGIEGSNSQLEKEIDLILAESFKLGPRDLNIIYNFLC